MERMETGLTLAPSDRNLHRRGCTAFSSGIEITISYYQYGMFVGLGLDTVE